MKKKLLRLLRLAPLALLFAGQAMAQTTGTLIGVVTDLSTGKPVEGAVVIASSPNLQGEQTAVTGVDGSYRIQLLPAGPYKLLVQLAGYKPFERSDIRLSADKMLRANMAVVPETVQLEEQVVRTGLAPVINVGSAETGTVVSRDFMANIPVGRSFQAIASVATAAAADPYGIGFQGGQSPENGYIVDGLNVTDPIYGAAPGTYTSRSAPTLLSDFLQEVDVKTSTFMPEYGRSTGGIINVVTRSGSNEFHGGAFTNFSPNSVFQPNGKTVGGNGEAVASFSKPSDGAFNLDLGATLGGPIVKDRLWFFAGFAPIFSKTTTDRYQRINVLNSDPGQANCLVRGTDPRCFDPSSGVAISSKVDGSDTKGADTQNSYQWVGKLTYLANENHTVTFATLGQPSRQNQYLPERAPDANNQFETTINSYDLIGHYGGKLMNKRLLVEVDAGWHGQRIKDDPNDYQRTRPQMRWTDPASPYSLSAFEPVNGCSDVFHCPVQDGTAYRTGGFGVLLDQTLGRYAGKGSVGALLSGAGSHSAKVGIDLERNYFENIKGYSGGVGGTVRGGNFRATRGYGHLLTGDVSSSLGDVVPTPVVTTKSYSNSFSYFAQDSWQVLNSGLTVNAGVRLETQEMVNQTNSANKLDVKDSWAPRVQAIWDFTGTGRGKVSASYGRYFWAIPLDMGDRTFGNETQLNYRQRVSCFLPGVTASNRYNPGAGVYGSFDTASLANAATGMPGCGTFPGGFAAQTGAGDLFTQIGNLTPVMPGLKASAVDMFGGQVEYEILSDLSVGIEYAGRRQVRVVEDMSPDDGNHYFIANPGENVTFTADGQTFSARNAVAGDVVTGRTINVTFPKAERSYDGLTLRLTKAHSRNWQAQASYTYSVLRGNYPGPSLPDYGVSGQGQLDPGITAYFDLPSLIYNTKGLLPGDHTHAIKLFGSYTWNLGPRYSVTAGGGYTGQSGRPMSAIGAHETYGAGLGYVIQQGGAGRTPFTHQLDVRGGLSYVLRAPYELKFSVDVLNLLNQQEVLLYDQNYTSDQIQPIHGIKCDVQAVGKPNPAAVLAAACPDVKFLKTINGAPVTPNPNWGHPLANARAYQIPMQVRFGLALAF